jgi:cysteine desulfurase
MKEIYLDNASTTKEYSSVTQLIKNLSQKEYGNPSSPHSLGEKSLFILNQSRLKFAKELNAKPNEIIFTSSATQSNNLAILGMAKAYPFKKTIIISSIEHSSVYEPCQFLKSQGYTIIEIPVNSDGLLNLEKLENAINKDVLFVSVIHAHNELGVIQNIDKIGQICKKHSVPLHLDAVQSFAKLPINVKKLNLSFLSASAHKIHGPKGCALLYKNEALKLLPITYGGHQEFSLLPGTENTPAIAGFALALEKIKKINKNKIEKLRNYLIDELSKLGAKINGSLTSRLYNNVNASLPIDSNLLVEYLSKKRLYISTKSACSENQSSENRILKAIGLKEPYFKGSFRITLSEFNSLKDIDFLIKEISLYLNKFKL